LNTGVGRINIADEKLDEHKRKKEDEKKAKMLSISHELYQSIQKDVINVFKQKSDMHKTEQIEDEHQLSQEDLCDYLLSRLLESGYFSTMEES